MDCSVVGQSYSVSTVCFICLKDQAVCFILCTLTGFYTDNFLLSCSAGRKRGFLSWAKGDRSSASLYPFYGFHSRSLPQRGDFILLLKSNRQEERWQQAGGRGNNGCSHLFEGVYTFCLLIWFAAVCVNRKKKGGHSLGNRVFFRMNFVSPAEMWEFQALWFYLTSVTNVYTLKHFSTSVAVWKRKKNDDMFHTSMFPVQVWKGIYINLSFDLTLSSIPQSRVYPRLL